MRVDTQWQWVSPAAPLSLVAGAGLAIATQALDLLGAGVGVAPPGIIGSQSALFGTDLGTTDGPGKPKLQVNIGTGLVTGDDCTLNLAFQLAPDTGSDGGYQPGAWQTVMETGPLTAAQCVANTIIARFDWPPVFPQTLRPRYARLLAQVPADEAFTAGTISFAAVVPNRDDQSNRQAQRNYSVS